MTTHRLSTPASPLSRAAFHLRTSATPRIAPPRPPRAPRTLRAAFSATLAVLLLAVLPGNVTAQVVAWGSNFYGETTVPAGALSGVTAIAAGAATPWHSRAMGA